MLLLTSIRTNQSPIWHRRKTISACPASISFPACLFKRNKRSLGTVRVTTRTMRPMPVRTAKMMYQNQRKMKIFSFKMLTGKTQNASNSCTVPDGPYALNKHFVILGNTCLQIYIITYCSIARNLKIGWDLRKTLDRYDLQDPCQFD